MYWAVSDAMGSSGDDAVADADSEDDSCSSERSI